MPEVHPVMKTDALLPPALAVRADLKVESLDDELVLYDPANGRAYLLNRTAAAMWTRWNGATSAPDVARDVADACGVAYEDVLADMHDLIGQLARAGLLADQATA